jgi:hypothetical protein
MPLGKNGIFRKSYGREFDVAGFQRHDLLDTYLANVEQNDSRKIYRAKHVLSKIEGTPSMQRKIVTVSPNLGARCAFARDMFFRFLLHPNISNFWLAL